MTRREQVPFENGCGSDTRRPGVAPGGPLGFNASK